MKKIKSDINLVAMTLLELLIAIGMLGIGLTAIMEMTNVSMTNVDRIRQEVIGINLAREGVEVVQQVRDTNWFRRFGVKDSCRLKKDPLFDDDGNCTNDAWLSSGSYIFTSVSTGGQKYFVFSGSFSSGLDLTYFDAGIDDKFSLCYSSTGGRFQCPGMMNPRSEGYFFREIKGIGLYQKNIDIEGGKLLNCPNGSSATCNSSDAKEYRFCSRVEYVKGKRSQIELCSMITNFEE